MDAFLDLFKNVSSFDLSYLVITILSLVRCTKKGFVLSILSASKWILAYVITLILFPKVKPFVNDIIDNEYVLDIILGVSIFTIIIFNCVNNLMQYFKIYITHLSCALVAHLDSAPDFGSGG